MHTLSVEHLVGTTLQWQKRTMTVTPVMCLCGTKTKRACLEGFLLQALKKRNWSANAFQHAVVMHVVRCTHLVDIHRMLAV